MKTVSRIALILLTVAAIGTGLLSQQIATLWAAPSQQSDLPALAVLTPENSTAMAEALRLDAKGVTDARFFPDGKTMALAMPEGVVLYDVATWTPQRTLVTGASRRIAISADGEMVATMAGNEAQLWRVSDGALLQTLSGHSNTIEDLAFSPASSPENILATASLDRTVRLWRASDGELHRQLSHLGHVYSVVFRFDNLVLASGSDAGTTLWDPDRGGRLRIADVSFDIVNQLAFSPDGLTLALAMNAGLVKIRNGANYGTVHETPRNQATTALAFAPNGRLLAYGNSDERIYVGGSGGNAPFVTLSGHQGAINSLTFSPDGRLLVSTGADGTLRVWGSKDQTPPTATAAPTATPRPTLSPTVAPTATPVTRVTVVVRAPTSPLATPNATPNATPPSDAPQPPASSAAGLPRSGPSDAAQDDEGSPLPVVFIEPQEIALAPTDWQRVTHISGPGANVTLCQDERLWLSSNQQVWSFDGQEWRQELADQAATVACDPDGVPYALVTSPSAEAGRIVATLYRHQENAWKEVGISSFPAGAGQIWFDWAVDRDGSLWTPIMLDAGPNDSGTANADTEEENSEEGAGADQAVINGVVHYDQGVWDLYVAEGEMRLDDSNSLPGSLVKGMTIHKLIPAEFVGPATLAADAWSAPLTFYPDIDILADGTVWLKRPGQWPLFFDGEQWQLGVDTDLPAQLLATFSTDGTDNPEANPGSSALQESLITQVTSVMVGVLNAQDATEDAPQEATWIAVGGGVLHKQDGQWTLYVPYDYPDTLIPLAEGADGSVWFWDGLGIMRFDGVEWQSFRGDEEFTFLFNPMNSWPAATLDASVGPDGALWMGGLRLLPDGTPISLPVADESGS